MRKEADRLAGEAQIERSVKLNAKSITVGCVCVYKKPLVESRFVCFCKIDFHRLVHFNKPKGENPRHCPWEVGGDLSSGQQESGAGGGSCALRGDTTGDKTDSARQAGPAPRVSATPRRRWVPPSILRNHDAPDGDAKHDIIFRKVRGILNKLTPEKFTKLSDDLLALELDSDKVLKGVILLIFEKALDEPKYSSMYAQLCKRLSEEAPDFEPRGSPCTFRLLLLNRCRTEFENRAMAFDQYEERALDADDQEKRQLAKRKMLGNIKFIGELGKLEILAESILHRCIQNLLARRAAADHHEDLECLAQLVRTCGRVLDSERGRGLMDQYFARIESLSRSDGLQLRIRFMLRDVVELRRGGWVPRAASSHEGPVPMHQLRDERRAPPERDQLFRGVPLRSRPMDDMFGGLGLQPGSALLPPPDKLFAAFGASRDRDRDRDRDYRQRSAPSYFPRTAPSHANNNNHFNKQQQQHSHPSKESGGGGGGGARGKSRLLTTGGALADVQMRPAANSLMFTANRISKPQPQLAPAQQSVLPPAFSAAPPLLKEPAITIKPAADKRDKKDKKDKGPNKEEACRLALEALVDVAREYDPEAEAAPARDDDDDRPVSSDSLRRLRDMQAPDKVVRRCIAGVLEHVLQDEGEAGGTEAALWAAARVLRGVKRAPLHEGARQVLLGSAGGGGAARERLPRLLAHLARARLVALAEVGAWCEGGAHHPLLLEVLAALLAGLRGDEAALRRLVDDAKLDVGAYASEAGGGAGETRADRALALLEARGLGALAPQLRVRAALARALVAEPAPHALFRWIKGNVESGVRSSPAFVSALVSLLAAHVTRAADAAHGAPEKAALEREKALLEAYAPVLTALLAQRPDLQLAAVYAAQLHAHDHHYPKGMLLRWFMHLYNLEVCEEDAFLRWREDVTDAYPGKGEALFQVNTWLTWLQQQESEEEEGED